jgi:hypothetical protein
VRRARAIYVRSAIGPLLRVSKKEALGALPREGEAIRCLFFADALAVVGE